MTRIVCLLLIILFACRKDDSDVVLILPAVTQTGADTFGFLVDGAVWTNYGQVCQPNGGTCRDNLVGAYFPADGVITIKADQVVYKDGVAQTQYFELNFQTDAGAEKTYQTATGDLMTVVWLPVGDPVGYVLDDMSPAFTVTVTRFDLSARIMSGTFSGSLTNNLSADERVVTEGRFDLKF